MALALFVTLPSQVGPSVTCAPSTELTAPPYLFKCTDGTHYDLTTAHQLGAHSGYLTATDTEEHSYYFGVAAAVTTVTCDDPINNPIAIQTWGQPQPPSFPSYQCATIGTKESQACVIGENEPGNTGPPPLSCEYTGGSDGRTVAVKYVCGMTQSLPTAKQEGQSHYIISMVGPSLCRQVTGGDEGWQWGDTITLLFFLFSFFYVFGGGLYNVKYNGATPWTKEAIPHWDHWQELPGLVQDGLRFSREKSLEAYEAGHTWYTGYPPKSEPAPTADYKGLDAAEEGAPVKAGH